MSKCSALYKCDDGEDSCFQKYVFHSFEMRLIAVYVACVCTTCTHYNTQKPCLDFEYTDAF